MVPSPTVAVLEPEIAAPTVPRCRFIEIPSFSDRRGTLSVVEGGALPFRIERFYYVHDVPAGGMRGGHAHRLEEEVIIALSGGLRVTVDDGQRRQEFHLHDPARGLYVPSLLWHELHDFVPGTVCGVLASRAYDGSDYFHRYDEFVAYRSGRR